jgi:hypothetical protein
LPSGGLSDKNQGAVDGHLPFGRILPQLPLTVEQPSDDITARMPEDESEDRLLRVDLYEIENKLDSIDVKLAAIPTQADVMRVALLALLTGAVFVLFGIEVLSR